MLTQRKGRGGEIPGQGSPATMTTMIRTRVHNPALLARPKKDLEGNNSNK